MPATLASPRGRSLGCSVERPRDDLEAELAPPWTQLATLNYRSLNARFGWLTESFLFPTSFNAQSLRQTIRSGRKLASIARLQSDGRRSVQRQHLGVRHIDGHLRDELLVALADVPRSRSDSSGPKQKLCPRHRWLRVFWRASRLNPAGGKVSFLDS